MMGYHSSQSPLHELIIDETGATDPKNNYERKDSSALLQREIFAWYVYEWSVSTFFVTVMTLLPLLITDQAQRVAIRIHGSKWVTPNGKICEPQSKDCFELPLMNGVIGNLDYAAFAQYCTVVAVILQVIVFFIIAPFADYSCLRKNFLIVAHILGSICCSLVIFESSDDLYILGGILLIFSNLFLGTASIFYNAYLPLLVKDFSLNVDVPIAGLGSLRPPETGVTGVRVHKLSALISSKGLSIGFVSQIVNLLVTLVILVLITDISLGVRLICLLTGMMMMMIFG
jgi:MFS-type transporter involved in bile tolerance (Atg22 family)